MNILLVQPNYESKNSFLDSIKMKIFWSPYITLQQIATFTPKKHNIDIVDEIYQNIDYNNNYDLVGITSNTPIATRAYDVADGFRKRGIKVVLGGYHPSALPEEAIKHADSVVIGEAENSWKELLEDFENKRLKEFYHSKTPTDLTNLPPIRRDIGKFHFSTARIEATRGCPNRCEFCSISNSKIGWHVFRKKPIKNVIKELEIIPQKFITFCDTSLTIDVEYSINLFKEMKHLNKKFICYGNSNILSKNERLLKSASEAGCMLWNIGLDSVSQDSLNTSGKKFNKVEEYSTAVKKIHNYNMPVLAQFIFGFDNDDYKIFDSTIEMIDQIGIDIPAFNILTPFPGTPLFDRFVNEDRILTRDWSKYDLTNVVFEPKNMSSLELENGFIDIVKKYHNYPNLIKRQIKSMKLGFNSTIGTFFQNIFEIGGYKKYLNQRLNSEN